MLAWKTLLLSRCATYARNLSLNPKWMHPLTQRPEEIAAVVRIVQRSEGKLALTCISVACRGLWCWHVQYSFICSKGNLRASRRANVPDSISPVREWGLHPPSRVPVHHRADLNGPPWSHTYSTAYSQETCSRRSYYCFGSQMCLLLAKIQKYPKYNLGAQLFFSMTLGWGWVLLCLSLFTLE